MTAVARHSRRTLAILALVLAGCQSIGTLTETPTRGISGPTLEPSPRVIPLLPTEPPPGFLTDGANNPTAAALPRDSGLPPRVVGEGAGGASQQIELIAADGERLTGDLYQSAAARLPAALIVSGNSAAWGVFPARVRDSGFTVLVMHVREPFDLSDFGVMLDALSTGIADPSHIIVIGAEDGAAFALTGCAQDLRCDALALLSPLGDERLVDALLAYNPRPVFISASQNDVEAFAVAQALDEAARGDRFFQPYDGGGRGPDLLINQPELSNLLIAWLIEQAGAA